MGRRSPESKSKKRAMQKVKRKLRYSQPSESGTMGTSEEAVGIDGDKAEDNDAVGEDMDVFEMNLDDSIQALQADQQEFSVQYLKDCRRKLLQKVTDYHKQLEDAKSMIVKLEYQKRQEIESIRMFYQNLMYAPTRSGRIIKASSTTSSAAVKIMKDLGLQYQYTGDAYIV